MSESNKNDPIFRSNSNIMNSNDWRSINRNDLGTHAKLNEKKSSLPANCQNEFQTSKQNHRKEIYKREEYNQKERSSSRNENYLDKNYLNKNYKTRSKVMLNGFDTLSLNYNRQEDEESSKLFSHNDVQKMEINKANVNKRPPDRVENKFKLPSSLSNKSNIENVSNFKNFNFTSSRFPYDRTHSGVNNSIDNNRNESPNYNRYLNISCSNDSIKRADYMLKPTDYITRDKLDRDHHQCSNNFAIASPMNASYKRNSNVSTETTPLSSKKFNLSLPLKNENSTTQDPKKILLQKDSNNVNKRNEQKSYQDQPAVNDSLLDNSTLAAVQSYESVKDRSLTQKTQVQRAKKINTDNLVSLNPRESFKYENEFTKLVAESFNDVNRLKDQLNEQTLEQISNKLSDRLTNQLSTKLSTKLSNELSNQLSNQIKNQVRGSHDVLYTDLNRLNTDLLKINGELNLLSNNFLKSDQENFDQIKSKDEIHLHPESIEIFTNENQPNQKTNQTSLLDYNLINLKLNSHLVHLVKHSELDQKCSSLLLNLITEDHCGIILCLGQSTLNDTQYSVNYYIGAISQNSTAEQKHLFTIGDLVLEINSRLLQLNSHMNLEKVTCLMNHQFNMNRYLQLRIVPRAVLMSRFKRKDGCQFGFNDAIRTVIINAQKLITKKDCSFGLTIKGGKEYGLGIWISNVDKGSLSDKSGLKAGDLIITLNGLDFLNLTHDHAAFLIRNTSVLILRVRNVGFVPISALLLDQNDEVTKFRSNSAIEMTDYDRINLRKMNRMSTKLNRIPLQSIKDELKANGLLNMKEIKEYLVNKYGSSNELKSNNLTNTLATSSKNGLDNCFNTSPINGIQLDKNYSQCSESSINNSQNIGEGAFQQNRSYVNNKMNNYSSKLVPNKMPLSSLFRNLNSFDTLPTNNLLNKNQTMPLFSSLSNDQSSSIYHTPLSTQDLPLSNITNNLTKVTNLTSTIPDTLQSTLYTNSLLPNTVSEFTKSDNRTPFSLIDTKTDLFNKFSLEDELERELLLEEQVDLLLNDNDKQTFHFYKNELLSNNITLNFFVYSICKLLDTAEKQNILLYIRPLINKKDLRHFDHLISIYKRQNYPFIEDEIAFNKLYRSYSYDDHLMDRENWINASSFNQNQNFGSSDEYSLQREPNFTIADRQFYHQFNRYNIFPLLNQSYLNSGQFDSMSPYHHYNQQSIDLQKNGIQQTNSPINSSISSRSPYLSALQSTRAINDCTTIHPKISDRRNCLTNNVYSNNNLLHLNPNDVNSSNAKYFHPSSLNSNLHNNNLNSAYNMTANNLVDFNEENQLLPELKNHQLSYSDPLSDHNMVKRHRSLPAGAFQKELVSNSFNKNHFNDQIHQRSASFKTPRRLFDREDCFRVQINKTKPILGIAIEGGINVPNQNLPRIISIHQSGSAYESGELKVGQIILEINGVSTESLTHSEIAKLLAHSYYTNQDNFIELVIKEKTRSDPFVRRNSLLMLNNDYE